MQRQSDPNDSRRYPDRPIVAVGVVIIRDSKCLLIKRGKAPRENEWSLPGGKQELGETMTACAIREAKEETGLDIAILGLIDTVDYIEKDQDGTPVMHYSLIDYAAKIIDGELAAGSDAKDAKFFDLTEIKALALWPETERVITATLDQFGGKS